MGDKLPTGNMQGILNWCAGCLADTVACSSRDASLSPLTPTRSLAQSDGTSSAKTVSEEDRKWFFEAMAVSPASDAWTLHKCSHARAWRRRLLTRWHGSNSSWRRRPETRRRLWRKSSWRLASLC